MSHLRPSMRTYSIVAILGAALAIGAFLIGYRVFTSPRFALDGAYQAIDRNDFASARAAADELLAKNPQDVAALLAKATAYAQEGSLTFQEDAYGAEGLALAQQVLTIDPKSSEAWRLIGYSYEIMERYADAHDAYAKAMAFDKTNVAAISQDAHAYDLEGDRTRAEAGYRRALALDPDFEQALFGLARIHAARGDVDTAVDLFERVARSSENARTRAESYYSAGVLLGAHNEAARAGRYMERATAADPTYALGWTGRAISVFLDALAPTNTQSVAVRNDAITASFDMLEKAIALNPNQSGAYIQLASQLITVGKTEAGVKILQGALTIVPQDISLSAADKKATLGIISGMIQAASELK